MNGSRGFELDMGNAPIIEMIANRRVTVEGSAGILRYESDNIKINTNQMILSFCGRGLRVRCITASCVEVEGFISQINFIC